MSRRVLLFLKGDRKAMNLGTRGGVGTERRGQRDNCGQDVSYERINKKKNMKKGRKYSYYT